MLLIGATRPHRKYPFGGQMSNPPAGRVILSLTTMADAAICISATPISLCNILFLRIRMILSMPVTDQMPHMPDFA